MLAFVFALLCAVADDSPTPQFQIETQIIDQSDPKYPVLDKAPKILVADGQSATIRDETDRLFVAAIKKVTNGQQPVIKVVKEGVNITVTPTNIDGDDVSLDVVIQNTKVKSVDERKIDDDGSVIQMPTVESIEVRTTKVMRIGKKTYITCGDRVCSFVVRMVEAPSAKPPLNAVDDPMRLGLR